jgi:hypothetical protein
MRRSNLMALVALAFAWAACPAPSPQGSDGGGLDAGDAGPDAGVDGGGADAGADAGGADAGADAGLLDAGFDGGSCDPTSITTLQACADVERYRQDLVTVTGMRVPGSAHWQQVQDFCAQRLAALGFTVERHTYTTGVNVVGVLPGSDLASEQVVVSAHYDHIQGCAGADDNASGVAGALEVARILSHGKYRRSAVVACWDEEERGLVGSVAWATRARGRGDVITAALVFEMIGYRNTDAGTQTLPTGLDVLFPTQAAAIHQNQDRGDFVALIGDDKAHAALVRLEARAQGLKTITLELTAAQKLSPLFSDLRRSDHAAFWFEDYAAVMIGDTGNFRNPNYHCIGGPDVVSDLDHAFATQIIAATVGAAGDLLEPR